MEILEADEVVVELELEVVPVLGGFIGVWVIDAAVVALVVVVVLMIVQTVVVVVVQV